MVSERRACYFIQFISLEESISADYYKEIITNNLVAIY